MKSSKAIYFLLTGAIIAAIAQFVVFYETETINEKEVVVPLVNKEVDAKPIEVKPTREETAETIKYASNSFLAVKISFINEIANLCDKTGADVHVVARAMGLDGRISPKFFKTELSRVESMCHT